MKKLFTIILWLCYIFGMTGFSWYFIDTITLGLNPATLGIGGLIVFLWLIGGICIKGLLDGVNEMLGK